MAKRPKARGPNAGDQLFGFPDDELVSIEKARKIALLCGRDDEEAVRTIKEHLIKGVWLFQSLQDNTDYRGQERPSYSEVRRRLREEWLPKASALKRLADQIDPDTELWLEIGARLPVDDHGRSISSVDEPEFANLGPHRIQAALWAAKRLPHYIESALAVCRI